jgi:hypothetical protein
MEVIISWRFEVCFMKSGEEIEERLYHQFPPHNLVLHFASPCDVLRYVSPQNRKRGVIG